MARMEHRRHQGAKGRSWKVYIHAGQLTDDEESSESQTSSVMAGTEHGTKIPDGTKMTVKPIRQASPKPIRQASPPAKQNPFFSLEVNNSRSWAQRAKPNMPPNHTPMQHLTQSSVDLFILTDAHSETQSVNLLDTSSIEPENDRKARPKMLPLDHNTKTIQVLNKEVAALKATIAEIKAWQYKKAPHIQHISQEVTMTREALEKMDIHELHENLHKLKSIAVQQETYDRNRVRVERETLDLCNENSKLQKRIDYLETGEWITKKEHQKENQGIHTDLASLHRTMKLQSEELTAKNEQTRNASPTSISKIEQKHEEVT